MLVPSKMALAGAESTREKYDAFFNSFNPDANYLYEDLNGSTIELTEVKCLSY